MLAWIKRLFAKPPEPNEPNELTPERRAYIEKVSREAMAKMWDDERKRKFKKKAFNDALDHAAKCRASQQKPRWTNKGGTWNKVCHRCQGAGVTTIYAGGYCDRDGVWHQLEDDVVDCWMCDKEGIIYT